MNPKKWLIAFFSTILGLGVALLAFNYYTDPFGAFGDRFLNWYSYDMTNNPRIAKLSYLEEHHGDYDSYIIGPSSTSSFSTEGLNDLYNASFYNYIMYGSDLLDCEEISRYLIDNYTVKNLVLNVYLGTGVTYDALPDRLTYSQHYLVDEDFSKEEYYWQYLTASPHFGINKLLDMRKDTLLTQPFDVFVPHTGVYDKSARDIEGIGSLEHYYESYPEFTNYPTGSLDLPYLEEAMGSISAIKAMCDEAGINFVVVTAPLYGGYIDYYEPQEILDFYTRLAEITPFWDFSISSVSYEPRYFYDTTHFRNNVGEMALARMAGKTEGYLPEDFGVWVTPDNVVSHFTSALQSSPIPEEEISAEVPVLMYHHFTEELGEGSNMSIAGFEGHMSALQSAGYTTVSFDELISYVKDGTPLPEKPVVITMDDGYSSNYELAYPILEQYDMKATIFAIGVSVGKTLYKDTDFQMTPHFSYDEASQMVQSGLVSIQSHTYDMHQWQPFESGIARADIRPFENESEEDYIAALTADFTRSREEISAALGTDVNVLAYPSGQHCDLAQYILSTLGVEVTLTTNFDTNTVVKGLPQSLYFMNRYSMDDGVSPEDLIALLEQ